MKILLTGADQPLGAAVARELAGAHHLRLTGRGEASDLPAGASYAVADLREPEAVAPLVSGMDAVVHLAAYTESVLTRESGSFQPACPPRIAKQLRILIQ